MRFCISTLNLLLISWGITTDKVTGFTTSKIAPSFNIRNNVNDCRFSSAGVVSVAINGDSEVASPPSSSSPATPIRLSTFEKARTVTSVCTSGTLCTSSTSSGIEGAPFGSFVDYVLDDEGSPVLLMNEMSAHTVNILQSGDVNSEGEGPLVTLFTQLASGRGQDVSRCSVTGRVERITPTAPDIDTLRMRYAIAHAYADRVMDSPKFAFYRLKPVKIYYVGGFGVTAAWVPVDEYKNAKSDILAQDAAEIVERLNRDHGADLELVGMHLLNVQNLEDVVITGVDRLGMDIRVTSQLRRNKLVTDEFRVGFRIPVQTVEDAKSEILKIFQEAWEKGQGYTWDDEGEDLPGSDVPIVQIAEDSLG